MLTKLQEFANDLRSSPLNRSPRLFVGGKGEDRSCLFKPGFRNWFSRTVGEVGKLMLLLHLYNLWHGRCCQQSRLRSHLQKKVTCSDLTSNFWIWKYFTKCLISSAGIAGTVLDAYSPCRGHITLFMTRNYF